MRFSLKTVVLALAVAFTISTGTALAAEWSSMPVQKVPPKVMVGYHKLFSHSRILKAEKSGSGPTVLYRLTIQRKGKPEAVLFDAQGHSQK